MDAADDADDMDGDAAVDGGEDAGGRMDPLLVLPPEVVLKVCALLPTADRARLGALSRGWRRLARDDSLWRGVRLDLRNLEHARSPADARAILRVLLRAPCLDHVHLGRPLDDELRDRVNEALSRVEEVRSLSGVSGETAGHEALLLRLAPHLEALRVEAPTPRQLAAVGGMAALRRLHLRHPHPKSAREWWAHTRDLSVGLPAQLEELEVLHIDRAQLVSLLRMRELRRLALRGVPPDHDVPFAPPPPPEHCRLQTLVVQVNFLDRPFVQALIRAHAASLRELEVFCAAMDRVLYSHAVVMPFDLFDLDLAVKLGALVRGAGLAAPRRLVLRRDDHPHSRADHDANSCSAQRQQVRDALAGSGVLVVCSACG